MPLVSGPSHQLMSKRTDIDQDAQPAAPDDGEPPPAPQVHVNGKPARDSTSTTTPPRPKSSASTVSQPSEGADASGWGANFWVTLADPQVRACLFCGGRRDGASDERLGQKVIGVVDVGPGGAARHVTVKSAIADLFTSPFL